MHRGLVQYSCLEGRGVSAMDALDRAFANVYSLLIVIIAMIQCDRNAPC